MPNKINGKVRNIKDLYIFVGRCIETTGSTVPAKECYCQPGFYGQTCEKESLLKSKKYNPSDYKEVKFQGDQFKFMWRFVGKCEVCKPWRVYYHKIKFIFILILMLYT